MVIDPLCAADEHYVYRARVAYDGTHYHGWQHQHGLLTVEGVLRDTFHRAFKTPLSLLAASRTDAGVHAYDQVIRMTTPLNLSPDRLKTVWNRVLPQAIIIRSLERCQSQFHPRYDVIQKEYWYHLFAKRPLPFVAPYGWHYGSSFDTKILSRCLQHVVGEHDFRSFCSGTSYASTVRTIDYIALQYIARYDTYRIIILGKRFMHFMIRRIVGAALTSAAHPLYGEEKFLTIFKSCNPKNNLPTAPAQGLLLRKICYTRET